MRLSERMQVERYEVGSELRERAYGPTPAEGSATGGFLAAIAALGVIAALVVIEASTQLIALAAIAAGVLVLMNATFSGFDRGHM